MSTSLLPRLSHYQISVSALAPSHIRTPHFSRFRIMADASNATERGAARQPSWFKPVSKAPEPVLRVYNSMTKSKVR